ncbi:MAG: L,D-transpeptidase, partial [Bdellovibrionales bacterium]
MTARSFLSSLFRATSLSRAASLACAIAITVIASPRAIAQAVNAPEAAVHTPPPERKITFNPADMADEKDWKRLYFDVVVVINKAANAQTIDVYRFGKLVKSSRVSTGRETMEYANPNKPSAPKKTYLSRTYTGYFAAQKLDIDHVSNTWADAYMPWAVFFNGGIATHRSPHEDLSQGVIDPNIGHRASGGCVRLHEQDAKDIFWMV